MPPISARAMSISAPRHTTSPANHKAVNVSRDVEFGDGGEIYAGMRQVGRWEMVPEKIPAALETKGA